MILSTGYGESGLRTVHVGRGLALSSMCICSSNSSANARGWLDDEPGSSHNRSAETGQGQRLARERRAAGPSWGSVSHGLPPPGGRRQLCGSPRRCGANTQELVGERENARTAFSKACGPRWEITAPTQALTRGVPSRFFRFSARDAIQNEALSLELPSACST
jgi:hypothetical protein